MSGDRRAAVRAWFDGAVREWDTERYQDQTYVGRARHALRWLRGMGSGKRVLDLGCGTGRQTVEAIRAGDRVVAADFSYEMARATRDRIVRECPGTAPAVVVADAQHPPFRPGSFDAVMALGVAGFVPDAPGMLREAAGLLRPGGTLVCDVGVPERRVLLDALGAAIDRPLLAVRRAWRRHVRRLPPDPPPPEHGWYRAHFVKIGPDRIEEMLGEAGLSAVARGGSGWGELRILGRPVLPWRVAQGVTVLLNRLTELPGGRLLARHALTYVVRAVRAPAPAPSPRAVPHPALELADAPAVGRQLRG
ncbi:MAG TPA: class I SAM-dependent methyltransferase [Longimicrobium sp.]|nr:class I SAM-dependent methyltransferase [Longimicrobium sp.]